MCLTGAGAVGEHDGWDGRHDPAMLLRNSTKSMNLDLWIYNGSMKDASALMRLLGDEARLRMLRVLSKDALNVTELTAVMGLAQSGVSRHLGLEDTPLEYTGVLRQLERHHAALDEQIP